MDPFSKKGEAARLWMPSRRSVLTGLGAGLIATRPFAQAMAAVQSPNRRRFAKLKRGLTASLWFEWVPRDRPGRTQRIDGKYQARDFAQIRALGFDHIRVTLHPSFLAPEIDNGNPTLHPDRLKIFDNAMTRITGQGLALVIDNRPTPETKDRMASSESYRDVMAAWWRNLAGHVASQSQYDPETTFLELLNEPEKSFADNVKYRATMERLIAAARQGAPNHTLIVGGNMWNVPAALIYNLKTPFADNNLIYTFHYYDPMPFTHQSVTYAGPVFAKLKGVPWGRGANGMSQAELAAFDPSVRDVMASYAQKSHRKADMRPAFVALREWCAKNDQVAWLGAFGVYFKGAPQADRVAWTRAVRELCEENKFGWCMYEARGGFGLFRNGETRPLDVDEPLLQALMAPNSEGSQS